MTIYDNLDPLQSTGIASQATVVHHLKAPTREAARSPPGLLLRQAWQSRAIVFETHGSARMGRGTNLPVWQRW